MAPELFTDRAARMRPAASVDVFAFGLLMYICMSGESASKSYDPNDVPGRFSRLAWPDGMLLREECRALCGECMQVDPRSRPAMVDVLDKILIDWLASIGVGFEVLGDSVVGMFACTVDWERGMRALRGVGQEDSAPHAQGADQAPAVADHIAAVESTKDASSAASNWFGAPRTAGSRPFVRL